jgi:hypothetical protein
MAGKGFSARRMSELAEAELSNILDILRSRGVKWAKVGILWVEFFPPQSPADQSPTVPKDLKPSDAPACACGHSILDHNDSNECMRGCPYEACTGENKPPG